MRLPFQEADPQHSDFQYLEDLATAYWYSEILFAAMDLGVFEKLERGHNRLRHLARETGCKPEELGRFLDVLQQLALVHRTRDRWYNSQAAAKFLVPESRSHMGHFLHYRRYMKTGWQKIAATLSCRRPEEAARPPREDDYPQRTFSYVRAMDELAKAKAVEIAGLLGDYGWHPPVLDVGGGAGTLARTLIRTKTNGQALLLDLPEVIQAARRLYPLPEAWQRVRAVGGDFRTWDMGSTGPFGLVALGNFLHTYSPTEARILLKKALDCLRTGGHLLIHDYFPDRPGRSPQKGVLYDLNMMLNTYNGACHKAATVTAWLDAEKIGPVHIRDLSTDSTVIIAGGPTGRHDDMGNRIHWVQVARDIGFAHAVMLPAEKIVTAPWPRYKCRYGCSQYGRRRQCPPHTMHHRETREMLDSYTRTLLVEGVPPGKRFHENLLALERHAFSAGYHKAFVFGAGPCPVCDSCPEDGGCRRPESARPSMEGAGIDVYETARNAGISLKPVTEENQYVKFLGLLLIV